MFQRLQHRRLLVLAITLLLGFFGLAYRLVDLQWVRHEELRRLAISKTHSMQVYPPLRGEIRDRNENVLAASVFVKTVVGNPVLVGDRRWEVARAIAPLLGEDETQVADRLRQEKKQRPDGTEVDVQYRVLKHKVPLDDWQTIEETLRRMGLPRLAVYAESDDQIRVYPNGALAAHVLGFAGQKPVEVNGKRLLQCVGAR